MDFTLPEELRMLRDTVARFVREELIPLKSTVSRKRRAMPDPITSCAVIGRPHAQTHRELLLQLCQYVDAGHAMAAHDQRIDLERDKRFEVARSDARERSDG